MDKLLEILSEYYWIFFIVAGVLIFALFGFIVDSKRKQKKAEGKVEAAPIETPVVADTSVVEPVQTEVAPVIEATTPVMDAPVVDTPVVEATPVETPTFGEPVSAPASEMTFNDVPAPAVENEMPAAPIIEEPKNDIFGSAPSMSNMDNTFIADSSIIEEPKVEEVVVESPVVEVPTVETIEMPAAPANPVQTEEPVIKLD